MHDMFKNWQRDNHQALQPPLIAWPTLILFLTSATIFFGSIYFFHSGKLPLWAAFLINSVCQFLMFTVLHDASHRALSQIQWLNEIIGTMAALIISPVAGIKVFRFIHMQHHRFTNAGYDLDPDQWSAKGNKWFLPLRWMIFDVHYFHWYLQHWHKRPLRERIEILVIIPSCIIAVSFLVMYGYGWHILCLWLLSGRIAEGLLILTFDYLPHVPHDTTAKENELRATNIRPNQSWLMTPILLNQNYHLIHHLFPRIPFYRYRWAWQQLRPQLIDSGALILDWHGNEILTHPENTATCGHTPKETG